jgi:hypothetical protein
VGKSDGKKDSFYEKLERVLDQFPKYHMNLLLQDFNVGVWKVDVFRPTIGNEILHEISNDNGVRAVTKVSNCQEYNVPTLQHS